MGILMVITVFPLIFDPKFNGKLVEMLSSLTQLSTQRGLFNQNLPIPIPSSHNIYQIFSRNDGNNENDRSVG